MGVKRNKYQRAMHRQKAGLAAAQNRKTVKALVFYALGQAIGAEIVKS